MKTYLHVVSDRFHLLLDATVVHEVVAEGAAPGGGDHAEWRGRVLPVIDTRRVLAGGAVAFGAAPKMHQSDADAGSAAVVYGLDQADEPPLFLKVDAVCGLRRLEETDFCLLPSVPARVASLFDRVHLDAATGTGLYRCRSDLRPGLGVPAGVTRAAQNEAASMTMVEG